MAQILICLSVSLIAGLLMSRLAKALTLPAVLDKEPVIANQIVCDDAYFAAIRKGMELVAGK